MDIRKSTESKYLQFLKFIAVQTIPFDIQKLIGEHKIDAKMPGYLKANNHLIKGEDKKVLAAFPINEITPVYEGFLKYRNVVEEEYKKSTKEYKEYLANKEFLVDRRTLASTISTQEEGEIVNKTIRTYSKEIVKYVKLGIELGKTDIEGFVLALIKIK